jgi:hypothetical protein
VNGSGGLLIRRGQIDSQRRHHPQDGRGRLDEDISAGSLPPPVMHGGAEDQPRDLAVLIEHRTIRGFAGATTDL